MHEMVKAAGAQIEVGLAIMADNLKRMTNVLGGRNMSAALATSSAQRPAANLTIPMQHQLPRTKLKPPPCRESLRNRL